MSSIAKEITKLIDDVTGGMPITEVEFSEEQFAELVQFVGTMKGEKNICFYKPKPGLIKAYFKQSDDLVFVWDAKTRFVHTTKLILPDPDYEEEM